MLMLLNSSARDSNLTALAPMLQIMTKSALAAATEFVQKPENYANDVKRESDVGKVIDGLEIAKLPLTPLISAAKNNMTELKSQFAADRESTVSTQAAKRRGGSDAPSTETGKDVANMADLDDFDEPEKKGFLARIVDAVVGFFNRLFGGEDKDADDIDVKKSSKSSKPPHIAEVVQTKEKEPTMQKTEKDQTQTPVINPLAKSDFTKRFPSKLGQEGSFADMVKNGRSESAGKVR